VTKGLNRLGKARRIIGRRAFSAVFETNIRRSCPPLVLVARPNARANTRMGISISRAVGIAVKRNGIKRRLREAFRQSRLQLPGGYDVVVIVRPHATLEVTRYQQLLIAGLNALHATWQKKQPDIAQP